MANIKSAKKKAKQSEKRRLVNLARTSDIKTTIKKFKLALDQKEVKDKAQILLSSIAAKLARAKSKGVIHRNTAARKLSSLAKLFNSVYKEEQSK